MGDSEENNNKNAIEIIGLKFFTFIKIIAGMSGGIFAAVLLTLVDNGKNGIFLCLGEVKGLEQLNMDIPLITCFVIISFFLFLYIFPYRILTYISVKEKNSTNFVFYDILVHFTFLLICLYISYLTYYTHDILYVTFCSGVTVTFFLCFLESCKSIAKMRKFNGKISHKKLYRIKHTYFIGIVLSCILASVIAVFLSQKYDIFVLELNYTPKEVVFEKFKDFQYLRVNNVKFSHYKFKDVDFSHSEMHSVEFDSCVFENIVFNGSTLYKSFSEKVLFLNCTIDNSNFNKVNLKFNSFSNVIFPYNKTKNKYTKMDNAQMSNTNFDSCDMRGIKNIFPYQINYNVDIGKKCILSNSLEKMICDSIQQYQHILRKTNLYCN